MTSATAKISNGEILAESAVCLASAQLSNTQMMREREPHAQRSAHSIGKACLILRRRQRPRCEEGGNSSVWRYAQCAHREALTNEMIQAASTHCLERDDAVTFGMSDRSRTRSILDQTKPTTISEAKGQSSDSRAGMSTKTYLEMVCEAIPIIRDRKGASRAAIAKWIQDNCSKEAGAMFNARLRTALNTGIENGVLKQGNSAQRFRIGVLPKPTKPKKKKVASKKKTASKKKKTASKKKKPASKKKSASKKKKPSKASKKKTASRKKKPSASSKKKSSSKKKKAAPKRRSRK